QSQYTTNGAFDGTDLMLWNGDHLLVAGENGLLYTIDLVVDFKIDGSLTVTPKTVYLKSKAQKAAEKRVGIESSIAMYNQYVYMADSYGALRCVDTTNMSTVWAVDTGDNIRKSFDSSSVWPVTVVIDRYGVIRYNSTKSMTYEKLREQIEKVY
ncbi:MAG: hypothetical protein IKS78_07980, partial [Clostridia bacterium]|nr:hypothetical protein [Clostridia bacterium]